MNELIKAFSEKGFLFPVQALILAADVYFVVKSNTNHYLLLSLILIASTIVLQAVRRRFMLSYPVNICMGGRSSAHIDTYYLRGVFVLSMLFLVLGLSLEYHERFKELDIIIGKHLLCLIIFFIVIVPILFCVFSGKLRKLIANKLKKGGSHIFLNSCPLCSSPSAIQENRIVDENRVSIKTTCLKCGKSAEYEISANIGE